MAFKKDWLPHRIWIQLMLLLMGIVIVSVCILSIMYSYLSYQSLHHTVLQDFQKISDVAAQKISDSIQLPLSLLQNTAHILGVLHAKQWQSETALVELGINFPFFKYIGLFTESADEIVSSLPSLPPPSISINPILQRFQTQSHYLSEVHFQDTYEHHIKMAVPVKNYGKRVSVLFAQVSISCIWAFVDQIGFNQTGKAFVLSGKGRYIAHPDKKRVLQNQKWDYFDAITNHKKHIATAERSFITRDNQYIISYTYIPEVNWWVVLEQSTAEAFASLRLIRIVGWVVTGIILALLGILSYFVSRMITAPLQELVRRTALVAEGNYNDKIQINRRDEIGELIRSFNIMIDALKTAKERENLAIIGKMVTSIVHDLKNAVSLVHTYILLFPDRQHDPDFIRQFSQIVPHELEQWMNMLKDIGDFSQHTQFELCALDLTALIKDELVLIKEKAYQQNILINQELCTEPVIIQGNIEKLKRVIVNLIYNACEAMPQGGALTISLKVESKVAVLCFADTGTGIEANMVETLFEPFKSSKVNGLGLGLSVSRDIICRHNGFIDCLNNQKKGASFIIRLPLCNIHQFVIRPNSKQQRREVTQ